jgi:hypothetical protein
MFERTDYAMFALCALVLVLAAAAPAAAERVSDPGNLVSIDAPADWPSVAPGGAATALRRMGKGHMKIIGIDPARTALLLINPGRARDLIPYISVTIADRGGLNPSEQELERLPRLIESVYSRMMGSRFKVLMLERSELGGLPSVKLTGIYRWRTVNIKVLQHLVPGSGRLYAVTFTSKERDFSGLHDEAEQVMNSIRIADPPLLLDWLWDAARWVVLLGLIGGVIWLTMVAASNRGEEGQSVSQFLRKK